MRSRRRPTRSTARATSALKAGLPIEVPAVTVNRLCGSGFEAITQGAQLILLGEADAVLAGGTESMSQAPHVVRGARWGIRLGPAAPLEDMLWEALRDPECGLSMAETAERLAERYKLTRNEVDQVALTSQQRAKQAWDACVFQNEVIAVPVKGKKGETTEFRADEHMRPATTLEVLRGLKPYFKKDGLVTAGQRLRDRRRRGGHRDRRRGLRAGARPQAAGPARRLGGGRAWSPASWASVPLRPRGRRSRRQRCSSSRWIWSK